MIGAYLRRGYKISLVLVGLLFSCHRAPEGSRARGQTPRALVPDKIAVVEPGDVLSEVLDSLLDGEDYVRGIRALDSVVGARKIRPGDTVKVYFENERLARIDYARGFTTRRVDFSDSGFVVDTITPDFVVRVEFVAGEVENSLYFAFLDKGEKIPLLIKYADMFGWDIDFTTESQKGDSFFLLVEKKYLDDTLAAYGRLLWGMYQGKTTGTKTGYYYQGDYYTPGGLSLRKAFLKSPLKVYRISSRYTSRRFHPILKIYRPHHGVDYAAPRGTPVHALGEGVVVYAGWKGGYGKYIRIKHPNEFQTGYGHLSRIAVSRGQHVSQGQVIGYVGATGLATGPHLHFEMFKSGRFVNPLAVELPPAEPVPPDQMDEFQKQVKLIDEYLGKIVPRDREGPGAP